MITVVILIIKSSVVPIAPILHTLSDESYTDSITEKLSINDGGGGENKLEEFSRINDSKFLPEVLQTQQLHLLWRPFVKGR